jgi:hypothetical protein
MATVIRADCRLLDIAVHVKIWLTRWQMESDKTPQLRLPDYYEQRNIRREVSSGEDDKGSATSSATHADTSPPSASPTLREPLLAPRDESANNTGEAAQELYLPFVAPASHSLFSLFRRWI